MSVLENHNRSNWRTFEVSASMAGGGSEQYKSFLFTRHRLLPMNCQHIVPSARVPLKIKTRGPHMFRHLLEQHGRALRNRGRSGSVKHSDS